jgi:MYXO-CTERM domain-containing protein
MWLQVAATVPSQSPQPFYQSGAWDATTGALTRDADLKIYEAQLGVAGVAAEDYPQAFHFATNQIVWKDNRIPPAGFDTTAANYAEMAPVPASSYPPVAGKLPNWDDTPYGIRVPADASGDIEVTVSLLYQTTSKDYVDFLASANSSNGRGSDLQRIWRNHDRAPPVVMAQQTFVIRNVAPAGPGGGDDGGEGPPVDDLGGAEPPGDDLAVPGEPEGEDMSVPDDLTPEPVPPLVGCSCDVGQRPTAPPAASLVLVAAAALLARMLRRRRR